MVVLKIVLLLSCAATIHGSQQMCDLDDTKCTTESANRTLKAEMEGKPDLWPSSDPMRIDAVIGEIEGLYMELTNLEMRGLKDCTVDLLSLNPSSSNYTYNIKCPGVLIEETDCVVDGYINDVYVQGSGKLTIERSGYNFNFKGGYVSYEGSNGDTYVQVTDDWTVDFECDGSVVYTFEGLFGGDQTKTLEVNNQINKDGLLVDRKYCQPTTMIKVAETYIHNKKAHLDVAPVKEYLYYELS